MGKYTGTLLCTDIDGTLTRERSIISEKNKKAIEYFISEGGAFTIASGRYPGFITALDTKPNVPVLSFNGSLIYDPASGKTVREGFLVSEALEIAKHTAKSFADIITSLRCFARDNHEIAPENSLSYLNGEHNIYKIVFVTDNEKDAVIIRDHLSKIVLEKELPIEIRRSWSTGVEIISSDANKGAACLFLKKYLSAERLVTVGDFENDISMLKVADISYAVENASDEIKKYAKKIAPRNTEDAIAFVIEDILK